MDNSSQPDVIIIGAGLFGSMTAKYFRDNGLDVLIIDNKHPMSASKCSSGVWKSTWTRQLKAIISEGQPLLDAYTGGIKSIQFKNLNQNKIEQYSHVDCSLILNEKFLEGEVTSVDNDLVTISNGEGITIMKAKKAVIVCAGAYTTKLLNKSYENQKQLPIVGKYWGSVAECNKSLSENTSYYWMKYKTALLFNDKPDWCTVSDGYTIKNPLEDDERFKKAEGHLLDNIKNTMGIEEINFKVNIIQGHRPYLRTGGSMEFINQHDNKLFSATGAAKSGTVLCGFIARQLFQKISDNPYSKTNQFPFEQFELNKKKTRERLGKLQLSIQ